MKIFKKILAVFMLIFVMSFSFTACNKNKDPNVPGPETNIENNTGNEGKDDDDGGNGDSDSEGDKDKDKEDEDDKIITRTLSAEAFLEEVLKKNISLSNYYSFEIEQHELNETKNYLGAVSVKSDIDVNSNDVKNLSVKLTSDGEIISYLRQKVVITKENIKTVTGLVIDEKKKYYSYIEDFSNSTAQQSAYDTYRLFTLLQNVIFMYDNELIYNGAFLKTYNFAFGVYVTDEVVTAESTGSTMVYKLECKNEFEKNSLLELVFDGDNLTKISYFKETENGKISISIVNSAEEEIILPDHTKGAYIQEKSAREEI